MEQWRQPGELVMLDEKYRGTALVQNHGSLWVIKELDFFGGSDETSYFCRSLATGYVKVFHEHNFVGEGADNGTEEGAQAPQG